MLVMVSTLANYARLQACSLDILDKGKPVARPGRKAWGRLVSAGGLVAERVKNQSIRQATRTEALLLNWHPAGTKQAALEKA
jgi:hypothetical protein